jgi:hemerythrin
MTPARPPLVWNDSFVTGVTEMDDQHMILVDLLNTAARRLSDNNNGGAVTQIVLDLLSYAIYHFETEEQLMEQYAYAKAAPEAAARHLEQHRGFSAKVVAAHEGLKTGEAIQADELVGFIHDWLINHILGTDRALGSYVAQQRGGR